MPTDPLLAKLDEIKALADAATEGPWTVADHRDRSEGHAHSGVSKYASMHLESEYAAKLPDAEWVYQETLWNVDQPKALCAENDRKGGIWWRNQNCRMLLPPSPKPRRSLWDE